MATREELERKAGAGDADAQVALAETLDAEGRHQEAINQLAAAARRNHPEALARLGARLLIGDRAPRMPDQAVGMIVDSARGSAAGALLLATLTALGAYRRQSWAEAFDLLTRAAEAGSASARAQLALLAGDAGLGREVRAAGEAAPADVWRRLRSSVDQAALFAAPEGRTLCDAPLIRSFPGFASPEVCDWLIRRAGERLKRAEVYSGDPNKTTRVGESRTNSLAAFWLTEIDLVQLALQARMAAATGLPQRHMESPTILHYAVGQEFRDHYDFVDPKTPNYQQIIAQFGERTKTFLVYLNDDYDGGETAFPRLGLAHKGARGEGMFFSNALPAGGPDERALHAGRPPTSGQKWVVSVFIRSRPFVPGVGG